MNDAPQDSDVAIAIGALCAVVDDIMQKIDYLIMRGETPKRWLTVSNAATYTDLSEDSIRRLLVSGKLTAHRPVKGRVLIDRLELDTVIAASTATPRKGRGRK